VIRPPLTAALLLAALVQPLAPQVIRGRLTTPGGEPVGGALVALLHEGGAPGRVAVSDSAGSFRIETGDTGSFALRIERIGFADLVTESFRLAADAVHAPTLVVPADARGLGNVRASNVPCVAGSTAGTAAALWQHAAKALRISAHAEEAGIPPVQGVRYVRLLDGSGSIHEGVVEQEPFARYAWPYPAVPIAALSGANFSARDSTDALVYLLPSPPVLLSSAFLQGHCLDRVIVRRNQQQRVGLGFRPAGGSSAPGLEGVLWLDRATAALTDVEFAYRNQNPELPRGAHGFIAFHRGPSGVPQVSRWWLRMPHKFQTIFRGGTSELNTSVVESGAIAFDAAGRPLSDPDGVYALLGGMFVFDPIEVQARRALEVMSEGAITRIRPEELIGAPATDAADVVRTLRPTWLARAQAWKLTEEGGGGDCVVYLDRMRVSRETGGLSDSTSTSCRDALAQIPAAWIASIEYVPPIEAAAIYGLGHGYGVIVIRSRRQ
jgi:hypothetical protein